MFGIMSLARKISHAHPPTAAIDVARYFEGKLSHDKGNIFIFNMDKLEASI